MLGTLFGTGVFSGYPLLMVLEFGWQDPNENKGHLMVIDFKGVGCSESLFYTLISTFKVFI